MNILLAGLSTTAIGLFVVFAVLCIIALTVSLLKYSAGGKPQATDVLVAPEKKAVLEPPISQPDPEALPEEEVAIIMAAIAASLNTTVDRLVVRSLKKASPWAEAAKKRR